MRCRRSTPSSGTVSTPERQHVRHATSPWRTRSAISSRRLASLSRTPLLARAGRWPAVPTPERRPNMPGNSQRRGAVRGSKKGPSTGSGGQRRKGLEARGATPKATDRTKHPAHKNALRGAKRAATPGARPARPARSGGSGSTRRTKGSSEIVYGRNSVLEALRADIPVATMYVAGRLESDDRVREALKIATGRGLSILETPRGELDRLTDGGVHQGLALQVPAYVYAHPSDLVNPEAPGIPLIVALDGITDPVSYTHLRAHET